MFLASNKLILQGKVLKLFVAFSFANRDNTYFVLYLC